MENVRARYVEPQGPVIQINFKKQFNIKILSEITSVL